MLIGAWAVISGYAVILMLTVSIFGRIPAWMVSFWRIPYLGQSVKFFLVSSLLVLIGYGIRALYRQGMKRDILSK